MTIFADDFLAMPLFSRRHRLAAEVACHLMFLPVRAAQAVRAMAAMRYAAAAYAMRRASSVCAMSTQERFTPGIRSRRRCDRRSADTAARGRGRRRLCA